MPQRGKLLAKIVEFNAENPYLVLRATDLEAIESLLQTLSDSSHYHSSSVSLVQLSVALRMLQWPVAQQFPLFDTLRLVALHPQGAEALGLHTQRGSLLSALTAVLESEEASTPFATVLTACRFVCNAFRHEAFRRVMSANSQDLLQLLHSTTRQVRHSHKLVRIAVATVFMNASFRVVQLAGSHPVEEVLTTLIASLCSLISREMDSAEVVFRALQATGTLLDHHSITVAQSDKALLTSMAADLSARWSPQRLGEAPSQCLNEVRQLLAI